MTNILIPKKQKTTNQFVENQEYEEMIEQLSLLANESEMIRRYQQKMFLDNPEMLI